MTQARYERTQMNKANKRFYFDFEQYETPLHLFDNVMYCQVRRAVLISFVPQMFSESLRDWRRRNSGESRMHTGAEGARRKPNLSGKRTEQPYED